MKFLLKVFTQIRTQDFGVYSNKQTMFKGSYFLYLCMLYASKPCHKAPQKVIRRGLSEADKKQTLMMLVLLVVSTVNAHFYKKQKQDNSTYFAGLWAFLEANSIKCQERGDFI